MRLWTIQPIEVWEELNKKGYFICNPIKADYISNKELMERIQENDINIYPTFTENAPMFPLESFEMGVPCLLGNNNDYFVDTELGRYIILEKEDDAIYIRDKIIQVLENKNKVMELYIEWKKEFDKKCDKWTERFIKM